MIGVIITYYLYIKSKDRYPIVIVSFLAGEYNIKELNHERQVCSVATELRKNWTDGFQT